MSHLASVGYPEFIARDQDHYEELAVSLAYDEDRLDGIRTQLRAQMATSAICDHKAFAKNFSLLMRGIWRGWCGLKKIQQN